MSPERQMSDKSRRYRERDARLGIDRKWPEDKPPGKFVGDLLGWDQEKFTGPARGLDRAVERAQNFELWSPEIEERTLRFATSFGLLYAENYLQAANNIRILDGLREAPVNHQAQDTLYEVSLDAYRTLKRKAGQFFLKSYPAMIKLGQDPHQYLARVQSAKSAGGSLFAAKVATYLPDVIGKGGNPDEFSAAALAVRHDVSFKTSSLFMSLASEVASEGEGRMFDFKDRVIESAEVLGPETTAWALPAFVYLEHRAGVNSAQTQAEIAEIIKQKGDKAAQWYIAGLRRIGGAMINPDDDPSKYRRRLEHPEDIIPTVQTLEDFKAVYPQVLDRLGITAASFFSRTVEFTDPASYMDAMVYAQGVIGKPLFDKALWAIIRSSKGAWNHGEATSAWMMFNHLVSKYRRNPDEKFSALMDYAVKTASFKDSRLGTLSPRRKMSEELQARYGFEGYSSDYASTDEGETELYRKWRAPQREATQRWLASQNKS